MHSPFNNVYGGRGTQILPSWGSQFAKVQIAYVTHSTLGPPNRGMKVATTPPPLTIPTVGRDHSGHMAVADITHTFSRSRLLRFSKGRNQNGNTSLTKMQYPKCRGINTDVTLWPLTC